MQTVTIEKLNISETTSPETGNLNSDTNCFNFLKELKRIGELTDNNAIDYIRLYEMIRKNNGFTEPLQHTIIDIDTVKKDNVVSRKYQKKMSIKNTSKKFPIRISISTRDFSSYAMITSSSGSCTAIKGSPVKENVSESFLSKPELVRLRNSLINNKIIIWNSKSNRLEFSKNYDFDKPSPLASIICGSPSDGWVTFKQENGENIRELKA